MGVRKSLEVQTSHAGRGLNQGGAGRPHDFPSKNHSLKSKNSGVREHARHRQSVVSLLPGHLVL